MTKTADSMVTVGRIIRPHGHRGSVVVAPETDFPDERFKPGSELFWRRGAEADSIVRVAESREYRGRWVVTLEGVATMNEAEALRGVELKVPADAVHPLKAREYYLHDLEGCEVVTPAGETVGRVAGVQFGSGAPLLQVTDEHGGEVLVPMVEGICREIDPGAKRIVIDPPAGLIEVNRRAQPKEEGKP
jgi:16S rRNA processing protein RimM